MKIITTLGLVACMSMMPLFVAAQNKTVKIKMVETTDVHSAFFAQDTPGQNNNTSLTRVSAFVKEQRKEWGDRLILMDNGDLLQGRPIVYYMNYVDTGELHQAARMLNYMKYDVANMGNHDVETSHATYDRWIEQCNMSVLGANIVDAKTNKPWLPPYQIIERDGVKIAILGMLTPAIPSWLAETMWSGLCFQDMIECAKHWVPYIQKKEKPDLLVGLFHSGKDGGITKADGTPYESQTLQVAQQVPGFDIIFYGHDHQLNCETITNNAGKQVWMVDPANQCRAIGVAEVEFTLNSKGKVIDKQISASLKDMSKAAVDEEMEKEFAQVKKEAQNYIARKIGMFHSTIESKYAFIGPCSFISLIHDIQMKISGAPISITAPLGMNNIIHEGEVTVNDMFQLYRFENYLYAMRLTGQEIKDLLEMSYGDWTNQMKSTADDLFALNRSNGRVQFKAFSYNFDSAQGINYTVDVTKPRGQKLNITTLADGTPFDLKKEYIVAINSYRGNGGGDLLTKGAGIPKEELMKRVVFSTDRDLRHYLIEYIESQQEIIPKNANNWKFVPEEWAKPAGERNMQELFK